MSFNGSGTFNINTAGQPVVTGTVISSSVFNALTADLATGLSTCITKDGQTTVTANIPMNSFKFTGLAAGTAATDSVRLGQLQAGAATLITVTGTNTYSGTMTPALSAYAAGNTFSFLVPNTNTTSCTLNIDGLGAKSITRDGTTALVAGDLVANSEVVVVYDGTQFQVLNSNSKTNFNLSGTLTVAGNTTLSGGTANGVAYLNGSKVLTTGSALTFDGSTLTATTTSGIPLVVTGTGSVGARIVGGTGVGAGAYINLQAQGGNAGLIGTEAAILGSGTSTNLMLYGYGSNSIVFAPATVEGMRLTSTGLGIGTSSPGSKLQVNSTGVGVAKLVDTSATGYSGLTFAGTGTQNYAIGMGGPSEATFGVANKWFLYDGLAGAMRMTLNASGNFTINAPSSGESLTVNTVAGLGIKATAAELPRLATQSTAVIASIRSYNAGAVGLFGTETNHGIEIRTNDTARITASSTGNVTINAPSSGTALTVGPGSNAVLAIGSTSTANSSALNLLGSSTGYNWQISSQNITTDALTITPSTAAGGSTFSSPAVTLTASGNLGLGVTPSAWGANYKALDVGGSGGYFVNNGSLVGIAQNFYQNGTNDVYKTTAAATRYYQASGAHYWNIAPSGTAGTAITFTQAMTLDSSGNLLVGTTTATSKFVVSSSGDTLATIVGGAANAKGVSFYDASTNGAQIYSVSSDLRFFTVATGSSTERARIDSSGNLLVGTTSVFSASRLTIQGNATYSAAILGTAGNTTSNALFLGLGGNRSTDTTYSVINYVDTDGTGTARFRVYGNGNVVNTNNSYGAISDVKLKENVTDATPKLDNLCKIRIVNYNLIGDEAKEKRIGVIAQELEQVFPSLVDESADLDEEGNPTGTTTKAVKYSVFVPMLIKAMQEQQAMIEELKARIVTLENK